jgi:NAD(P)-dependent dehydrogenase (short-subunit alcohol dehydrogenase family)
VADPQKVAIITGASQGIGAGLVSRFREAGYGVVGTSRTIATSDGPSYVTVGGLTAVARALAIEYATRGVRVNAVALGVIRTPMHHPTTHEALGTAHPLRRMGEIADVVDGILYLERAAFVTGEILHIDGGQSAGS